MEAAIGFEPMNGGFADLSLNHLGTPPKDPFYRLVRRKPGVLQHNRAVSSRVLRGYATLATACLIPQAGKL